MPRRFARLQHKDGSTIKLSRKQAFDLIATGDYYFLRRRPLVISEKLYENYNEELRHQSGRIVPGCTRVGLDGSLSRGRGCRVIIARSSLDPEATRTARILRNERAKIVAERERVVHWLDKKRKRDKLKRKKKRKHR